MAKLTLAFALCVLFAAAIVSAGRPNRNPLTLRGRVFCDTCKAGFETSATTYIAGARVRVECKHRQTYALIYSKEATTDVNGNYEMTIDDDHEDQMCDCLLVHSPQLGCTKLAPGRDRARVVLTRYNGIASSIRFANNMGFEKDEPEARCTEVRQPLSLDLGRSRLALPVIPSFSLFHLCSRRSLSPVACFSSFPSPSVLRSRHPLSPPSFSFFSVCPVVLRLSLSFPSFPSFPSLPVVPVRHSSAFPSVTPRRSPAACWLGRNEGSKKKSKLLDRLKLRLELYV
ncbi:hypothetical protein ACFE04_025417 [Oxalis oulophora]